MPPVVLVTGCTRGGIGFSLCEEFASKGCKVYATARRLEAMDGFQHEGIEKLVLDVTDDENMSRIVKMVIDAHGRIDIVVNNAGVICPGAILDVPLDDVHQTFETNVFSIVRMAQYVVPHMAKHGSGLIINIGSLMGDITTPWNGVYAGTKGALRQISDCLAMECKILNDKIKVMLVVTGAVKSNVANNAKMCLPENSLYRSFVNIIVNRVNMSQGPGSLPTAEYAKTVVAKALSPNPPLRMMCGGKTKQVALLEWLPRSWIFWYMVKMWRGTK